MWSLGVLLFVVLSGSLPFNAESLSQQIMGAEISFQSPVWKGISAEAKDLITKLVVVDPAKRLTIDEALQHPWIQNVLALEEEMSDRWSFRSSRASWRASYFRRRRRNRCRICSAMSS